MSLAILLLCIKVFFARILDVALGTLRTVLTVKGKLLYATIIGFFEVGIWFIVVREALSTNETGIAIAIAYASGFAIGTFLGGLLSEKVISGQLSIQVVTSNNSKKLINEIREAGYGVSVMNVMGRDTEKEKYMLFIEINNKNLNHLKQIIKSIDEKAFIVVHETRYVQNGFIK